MISLRSVRYRVRVFTAAILLILAIVLVINVIIWALSRPVPSKSKIYVLSHITRPDKMYPTEGRLSIIDPATRQEVFSIQTGISTDAALSKDGTRLFVAEMDVNTGQDQLYAIDTRTMKKIWHVSIADRIQYMFGRGSSALVPSLDGDLLYIYKAVSPNNSNQRLYRIDIVNTLDGQALEDTIPLSNCGAAELILSHSGDFLYATCWGSDDIRFVNLHTRQLEYQLRIPGAPELIGMPGRIAGMTLSSDGRNLYVMTDDFQIAVVDVMKPVITGIIKINHRSDQVVPEGAVRLSHDGAKLVVGISTQEDISTAKEVWLFDTRTWQVAEQFYLNFPISGRTLTVPTDGDAIYGVMAALMGEADTVIDINSGQNNVILRRSGEDIFRIFTRP